MKSFLALATFAILALDVRADAPRTVTVSGNCTRELLPDRSSISFTAEFRNKDATTAAKQATDAFERLRKKIRDKPPADLELETTEFSLNEDFDWQKGTRVSRGFVARAGLRVVSSDFTFSSKVIAIAVQEGIRDVGGLGSHVSTGALDKARFDCLEEALRNARDKAQKLAGAAGAGLGPVESIREDSASVEAPQAFQAFAKVQRFGGAEMDAGPTIERAKTRVNLAVTAAFRLR